MADMRGKWVRSPGHRSGPVPVLGMPMRDHPMYGGWRSMMNRCHRPEDKDFANYGGRGIVVCPEWRRFVPFVRWIEANIGMKPEGNTLDRIDLDGSYQPGNVRWATISQQGANTRARVATSKYKGVSLIRSSGKWGAWIRANGKSQTLGRYTTEQEAARAYDRAALVSFGEFARVNFPSNGGQ